MNLPCQAKVLLDYRAVQQRQAETARMVSAYPGRFRKQHGNNLDKFESRAVVDV